MARRWSLTIARPALFPARYRVPVERLESISWWASVLTPTAGFAFDYCMNGTRRLEKSEADLVTRLANPRSSGARLGPSQEAVSHPGERMLLAVC